MFPWIYLQSSYVKKLPGKARPKAFMANTQQQIRGGGTSHHLLPSWLLPSSSSSNKSSSLSSIPHQTLMATSHRKTAEDVDHYPGYKEEFGSRRPSRLSFLSFRCSSGIKPLSRSGYRSLRHEDCADHKETCWQEGVTRARRFLSKFTRRVRWRALLNKVRRSCSKIKRRKPMFKYDSRNYRLNFDDGVIDHEVNGDDCIGYLS